MASLLSDIGGSVGLWLGASLVTFAEVFALVANMVVYCCSATPVARRWAAAAEDEQQLRRL